MRRAGKHLLWVFFGWALLLCSCKKDDVTPASVSLLSITADGSPLADGAVNIDTLADIRLVFSRALSLNGISSNVRFTGPGGTSVLTDISLVNASSAVMINADLGPETQYKIEVLPGAIGANGETLDAGVARMFTTAGKGIVTEQAPCLSAGGDCARTLEITQGTGKGIIHFYGSFPLTPSNARWEKITSACIVVHGQNRDADQYYTSMVNPIRSIGLDDEMIILSPQFKDQGDASGDDLYWTTSGWREGSVSSGGLNISSFEVLDSILARLADKTIFPVLTDIVLAGHSSGATFVNTYAVANRAEHAFPDLQFHYVVANNQYFYYPEDVRYDASSMSFEPVTGCSDYNHWPFGFVNPPSYLGSMTKSIVDANITGREVLYLHGSADTSTSGTLNTTDCAAVLLGPNRFIRGQYMFDLLETHFPGHGSSFLVVPGVGHDNVGMFGSQVFKNWVLEIL